MKNAVLAKLAQAGAKFYPLGARSGLDGYLVIKDSQVQMLYITADNQNAIIGAMFDAAGENVTAAQVKTLMDSNKEVGDFFNRLSAGQQPGVPGAVPTAPAQIPPSGALPAATVTMPPAVAANPAAPKVSPGEQLIQALRGAAGVNVGAGAAPQILMIMDTNCPHCRATWKALRDQVLKGKLQLRMVPVGAPGSDDERTGARLLAATDPLGVWDKYAGGDKTVLAGAAEAAQLAAMEANHKLVDQWHIAVTPYLVYRAKNGQVKIVQGEIADVPAVLADLGG